MGWASLHFHVLEWASQGIRLVWTEKVRRWKEDGGCVIRSSDQSADPRTEFHRSKSRSCKQRSRSAAPLLFVWCKVIAFARLALGGATWFRGGYRWSRYGSGTTKCPSGLWEGKAQGFSCQLRAVCIANLTYLELRFSTYPYVLHCFTYYVSILFMISFIHIYTCFFLLGVTWSSSTSGKTTQDVHWIKRSLRMLGYILRVPSIGQTKRTTEGRPIVSDLYRYLKGWLSLESLKLLSPYRSLASLAHSWLWDSWLQKTEWPQGVCSRGSI